MIQAERGKLPLVATFILIRREEIVMQEPELYLCCPN